MRFRKFVQAASGSLLAVLAAAAAEAPAPHVRFREHVIEANIPGGYQLLVIDLNRDGRPDVVGLSGREPELFWYENPGWEKHVIVEGMYRMISVAGNDIDGDGIPELAVGSHFNQTDANSEGVLHRLEHQGDPREPWKKIEFDRLPTTHRLSFADIDGDGRKELINAPLTGPKAEKPLFERHTPLVYYRPGEWKRRMIYDALDGVVHGMRPAAWDDGDRSAVLTASFGGVRLHRSTGPGSSLKWTHDKLVPGDTSERPQGGASEIRVGRFGERRFLATIEPWHGNQVVVYTPAGDSGWTRNVIDRSFKDGHAVSVGDLNGDGLDEVVAGYRAEGAKLYVYYADAAGKQWKREVVDPAGMTAAGCEIADLNSDKRLDIVCIGSRTANIKWYENLGAGQ